MDKKKLAKAIRNAKKHCDCRVELYKGKECVAVIDGDIGYEYSIEYLNRYGYKVKNYALSIGRNENVRIIFDDFREEWL